MQYQVLNIKPSYQERGKKAQNFERKNSSLGVIADKIIFNPLQEYLFVREKCFNLRTTFLEDLSHYLSSQLVG